MSDRPFSIKELLGRVETNAAQHRAGSENTRSALFRTLPEASTTEQDTMRDNETTGGGEPERKPTN